MGLSASMTQTDLAEGFAVRRDRHEGDSWRAAEMARGRRLKRRASSQLIWMMRGGRAEVGPLLALKALQLTFALRNGTHYIYIYVSILGACVSISSSFSGISRSRFSIA